jgi:hypothetical protein
MEGKAGMDTETKTNLKTVLGIVGLGALWADPAPLTWVLFAVIVSWILWVTALSHLVAARLGTRS